MGLFSRKPPPTIRTGYRKTDQHLDQVITELEAAAQAGQRTHAISIGPLQAIQGTPAQTVPVYLDQLQKAGFAVESVSAPDWGPATLIVDLSDGIARSAVSDGPTSLGLPTPIKMIAALDNGWLYAIQDGNHWRSRYIFSDDTPEMDLREYPSFKALCIGEGHQHGQTMGAVGIIPSEMQEDFAAAFHESL